MSVIYFTDRDLGKQFPQILADAGLAIQRHSDLFAADTADADWLKHVSSRNWVAITHDKRIRYKPNELASVIAHRAALLVVIGKEPFSELAANFVGMKDKIASFVAEQQRPFIAKVYRPTPAELNKNRHALGRIERWYP